MLEFLKRFNKATIATIVAFIAQVAAPLLGWNITGQVQAGITEIIAQAAAIAVIIGAGVAAGPKNAPPPGVAEVKIAKLSTPAAKEVVKQAEATGAGLPNPSKSTVVQSHPLAMLFVVALFGMLPLGACDTLRQIAGEPTDIEVTESAEVQLVRAALLYEGLIDAIDMASEPGPDQLIVPGTPLAQKIGEAVGAATDALEIAKDAVVNKRSTMQVALNAAMAAINRALVLFVHDAKGDVS